MIEMKTCSFISCRIDLRREQSNGSRWYVVGSCINPAANTIYIFDVLRNRTLTINWSFDTCKTAERRDVGCLERTSEIRQSRRN